MKRIHVIAPLLGLLLFGVAYGRYAEKYDARLTAEKAAGLHAKEEKLKQQQATQLVARQHAIEATERRKREREADEQLESARKQERSAAEQLRNLTGDQERKLRGQLERLRADTQALEATVATLGVRRQSLEREREFLTNYVTQAEGNRAEFFRLVEKLEEAERARTAMPTTSAPGKPAATRNPNP